MYASIIALNMHLPPPRKWVGSVIFPSLPSAIRFFCLQTTRIANHIARRDVRARPGLSRHMKWVMNPDPWNMAILNFEDKGSNPFIGGSLWILRAVEKNRLYAIFWGEHFEKIYLKPPSLKKKHGWNCARLTIIPFELITVLDLLLRCLGKKQYSPNGGEFYGDFPW